MALAAKQRQTEKNYTETELLVLPDGQILVHNLTPAFAELLRQLNPDDEQIRPRATIAGRPQTQISPPPL